MLVGLLCAKSAFASDGAPFPNLNTEGYCTALVSKMLDKAEQKIEKEKCLQDEEAMRRKIEPLWGILSQDHQQYALTFVREGEVRTQTYTPLVKVAYLGVGTACIDGRFVCEPKSERIDATYSAIRSDVYCHARASRISDQKRSKALNDCLAGEKHWKAALAPFWDNVRPQTQETCLSVFSNLLSQPFKNSIYPPFRTLAVCSTLDIGLSCLEGGLRCEAK